MVRVEKDDNYNGQGPNSKGKSCGPSKGIAGIEAFKAEEGAPKKPLQKSSINLLTETPLPTAPLYTEIPG